MSADLRTPSMFAASPDVFKNLKLQSKGMQQVFQNYNNLTVFQTCIWCHLSGIFVYDFRAEDTVIL